MKIIKSILYSSILTSMFLYSCMTDDIVADDDCRLQIAVSTGSYSDGRTVITGNYLPDKSEIGVCIEDKGGVYAELGYSNVPYLASGWGKAQTWNTIIPISLDLTMAQVYAYYPYSPDMHVSAIPVSTEDQTDYMYGLPVGGVCVYNHEVDIILKHALSCIRISFEKDTYQGPGEISEMTVTSGSFCMNAVLDGREGSLSGFSGNGEWSEKETFVLNGEIVKDILVVPCGVKDTITVMAVVDGISYTATTPEVLLEQGIVYEFKVRMKGTEITIESLVVNDFQTDGEKDVEFEKI